MSEPINWYTINARALDAVTPEMVAAYLTAKGWGWAVDDDCWMKGDVGVWFAAKPHHGDYARRLAEAAEALGRYEGRHAIFVLREMAGQP